MGVDSAHPGSTCRSVPPSELGQSVVFRTPPRKSGSADDRETAKQCLGPETNFRRYSRRWIPSSLLVLGALDSLAIAMALTGTFGFIHERLEIATLGQTAVTILVSLLIFMVLLHAVGSYRRDTVINPSISLSRIPVALGLGALIQFAVMHYLLPEIYPDHVYLSISRCATIVLTGVGVALFSTIVSRALFMTMAKRHWFRRRILVLGTGTRAAYLQKLMNAEPQRAVLDLVFAPESTMGGSYNTEQCAIPQNLIVPGDKSIPVLSNELVVDEIVVAIDERRGLSFASLLACKMNGIPITDCNAFIERETGRVDLRWFDLSWILYAGSLQIQVLDAAVKRFLDFAISLIFLFISVPVLAVAIFCIRLESAGPVFYRQQRVTCDGKVFWLYKLRTMKTDAEKEGPSWAEIDDPRVTRVGTFLRRVRIDEVPQLVNVLRGDMSLVGPRPERPVFVEQLSQEIELYKLRHTVRAGLTGWAQINYPYGASVGDAKRKLEYDLYYIKNFNLLRDLSILAQTLWVLIWPLGVR